MRLTKVCEECGVEFAIPKHRTHTARACSRKCLGKIQSRERKGKFGVGEDNPMWIDGRSPIYYRKFLQGPCEQCGSTKNLLIHHRDHDRTNSKP